MHFHKEKLEWKVCEMNEHFLFKKKTDDVLANKISAKREHPQATQFFDGIVVGTCEQGFTT